MDQQQQNTSKQDSTQIQGTGRAHKKGDSKWRTIAGQNFYFRSRWEFNYALYLQLLKTTGKISGWEHEPRTFWFKKILRGVRSYLPDFRVIHLNGSQEYVEVKGFMDARSATKLKRMGIYYPEIHIRVVDKDWFTENTKRLKTLIPEWEKGEDKTRH